VTAPVVARAAFRFSADGRRAACLATDDDGRRFAEAWELTRTGPRMIARAEAPGSSMAAQVLALMGGRVLRSWHSPGWQTVELIEPGGERRILGRTSTPLRLLPGYTSPGVLGLGVAVDPHSGSTLYELREEGHWLRPAARFPGPVGAVVVEVDRAYLTVVEDGRPTPIVVDPASEGSRPLLEFVPPYPCHVLLAGGGRVLLSVGTGQGHRLAVVPAQGADRVDLLDGPAGLAGPVTPAALDPAGQTLALLVGRGARSDLVLYDTDSRHGAEDRLRSVSLPPTELIPVAAWPGEGLWLPCSTPTRPAEFGWLIGTDLVMGVGAEPGREWRPGRVEKFAGPAGSIEAVVYGDGWRNERPVVVALHGGPEQHWTVGFDRLFQVLAETGVTVIALNQRGSTGYGPQHAAAVAGQWGGPDLADIRHLCANLRAGRPAGAPRPAVYGTSYGAFLALLAAAADPGSWSACVAVAPFRSAASLYAVAAQPVRNMIDRLGGRVTGPDLDVLAPRIAADVMIVHGALDEIIPVGQSRILVERLTTSGHPRVTYRELPDRGHDAIGAHAGPIVTEIAQFLARVIEPAGRR
jgi:alpha-beta hydrolase superfamily lysophospholipase